jgi:putative transposase
LSPTSRSPTRATTLIICATGSPQTGSEVVIPPKHNRTVQRPYDADLYKERNIIKRFFNRLKQFRRVATRCDKLLANFMGFVKLAAIAIWLK